MLLTIWLLHLLAFERNECRIHRLLDVVYVANNQHGWLIRTENRFVGGLHAMNATFAVLTWQPEPGSVCASVGAIPTETANQSERILTIHERAVRNDKTILFACLLPLTGFLA